MSRNLTEIWYDIREGDVTLDPAELGIVVDDVANCEGTRRAHGEGDLCSLIYALNNALQTSVERISPAYPLAENRSRWFAATGEIRPPREGEYFLSGAEIEAHRCYLDLETPYHIAREVEIVKIATVYKWKE